MSQHPLCEREELRIRNIFGDEQIAHVHFGADTTREPAANQNFVWLIAKKFDEPLFGNPSADASVEYRYRSRANLSANEVIIQEWNTTFVLQTRNESFAFCRDRKCDGDHCVAFTTRTCRNFLSLGLDAASSMETGDAAPSATNRRRKSISRFFGMSINRTIPLSSLSAFPAEPPVSLAAEITLFAISSC